MAIADASSGLPLTKTPLLFHQQYDTWDVEPLITMQIVFFGRLNLSPGLLIVKTFLNIFHLLHLHNLQARASYLEPSEKISKTASCHQQFGSNTYKPKGTQIYRYLKERVHMLRDLFLILPMIN